jgi:apolipoprotein N-acyltransferase
VSDVDDDRPEYLDRGLLAAALVAFLALLAAYVVLAVTHNDAEGVVRLATTLAAVFGLGVYQRATHKATARKLDQQNTALAQITEQTNGVLTARIKNAVHEALAEAVTDESVKRGAEEAMTKALQEAGLGDLPDRR